MQCGWVCVCVYVCVVAWSAPSASLTKCELGESSFSLSLSLSCSFKNLRSENAAVMPCFLCVLSAWWMIILVKLEHTYTHIYTSILAINERLEQRANKSGKSRQTRAGVCRFQDATATDSSRPRPSVESCSNRMRDAEWSKMSFSLSLSFSFILLMVLSVLQCTHVFNIQCPMGALPCVQLLYKLMVKCIHWRGNDGQERDSNNMARFQFVYVRVFWDEIPNFV